MVPPGWTGEGLAVCVNARFVRALTRLLAELLLVDPSLVLVWTVAVLVIVLPTGAPGLTRATTVKVAEPPAGRVAIVSRILLPLWPRLAGVPAVCFCDRNVSLAGRVSLRDTAWASLGPLLVTV